jgi:hypothetical protein
MVKKRDMLTEPSETYEELQREPVAEQQHVVISNLEAPFNMARVH